MTMDLSTSRYSVARYLNTPHSTSQCSGGTWTDLKPVESVVDQAPAAVVQQLSGVGCCSDMRWWCCGGEGEGHAW